MENKKLKRGQEIKLKISDLAFGGKGISKKDDLVFFVKDAIPNQEVIAKISKIKKKYAEAYSIETLKDSTDQVNPVCEHFKWCGGCTTQQLDYQKQLYYKQKQVSDILNKIGGEKNLDINTIIGCAHTFFYRNKMEYTFSGIPWYIGDESYNDVIVGLHVPKRFDKILNINKCHINHEVFNDILEISKEIAVKEKMIPYHVRKHTGFLRFLVIRIGIHTNEVMVNLVTAGYKPKIIKPLVDALVDRIPNIKSIVNTINNQKSNIASGTSKLLYGDEYINEKIGDYTFKISANSFFQTNSYQVKTLYDYIIKTADFKKSDIVYDLYCGTGTIGIYISSFVKKVYGIEIVKDAIKDAKFNAKKNNIKNISFYDSDIKDFFTNQNTKIDKPNTIIIDPPRPGLHPNVIKDIITLSPSKIIYVSCNPSTQARDVKIFLEEDYKICNIQPIDMFPHTPHIECIITLKK
ncbi:MAG: 23S rRNA (uracil(1939)-C(5))-methyltransferase RlmD [Candidatus Marinimicrobia bacterium]|nr:23S rRNA (uracil(1939)-C(5))-methyltransferase RlmD [Candidatus Neomarinimicrobiota bacterium]